MDFVCKRWLHGEHILNAFHYSFLSCLHLFDIFSACLVSYSTTQILDTTFFLCCFWNDVRNSKKTDAMNESMYNAYTLYKHNVNWCKRTEKRRKKNTTESQEIINVPSYEFLYRARKKSYEEKLDIFPANSTKQEKCARNNNNHDNIVRWSSRNALTHTHTDSHALNIRE